MTMERLRAELVAAEAELKRHMASWEYAFAMGSSCHGQGEHPTHWATRAVTRSPGIAPPTSTICPLRRAIIRPPAAGFSTVS